MNDVWETDLSTRSVFTERALGVEGEELVSCPCGH